MHALQQKREPRSRDAGLSLIEVLVALIIFGILSTGIVAGITTITRMTVDNRARVVAAGLAAQDIALARAVGDPFDLSATPTTTSTSTIDGRTYTLTRTVNLVSQAGVDVACNTSSDLFYARVNVRVKWANQLPTTANVQDDTIVASQGLINDSATGAITVNVVDRDGNPEPGVQVRVAAGADGAALTSQPADTDANGCTRAGGVTPGTYTVTLTKTGYKDVLQRDAATKSVLVTAGTNQSLSFQYDQAATVGTAYIPWPVAYTASVPQKPSNLDTTFLNTTSGPYTTTAPATSVKLHPFLSGYSATGGTPADTSGTTKCAANDPTAWAATNSGRNRATGIRATASTTPGGTSDFKTGSTTGIGLGVVTLNVAANLYIKATTATPAYGTDYPGCTTTTTYLFAAATVNGSNAIALPYGAYTISTAPSATGTYTQVTDVSKLGIPTNVATGGVQGTGVVVLDPRAAA